MTYDIDLMRKILFAIEKEYEAGELWIFGPKIDGYKMETIAEHCKWLQQKGLLDGFEPHTGGGRIMDFRIGNMTIFGAEYLEAVRDDALWEKMKTELAEQKRPNTIDEIARLAGLFTGGFTQGFTG